MRRILIVDDEEDILVSLKHLLERNNKEYRVALARDGEEAWEILKSAPQDLVILDLAMPKMGGEKLLQLIRSDAAMTDMPVIVSTVTRETSAMVKLMDAGATDYLMKPYDIRELTKVIETYI
ncbi:MAG: response regulator [Deltaproteobacteria bacterium]